MVQWKGTKAMSSTVRSWITWAPWHILAGVEVPELPPVQPAAAGSENLVQSCLASDLALSSIENYLKTKNYIFKTI